jgi:hypothetical protein
MIYFTFFNKNEKRVLFDQKLFYPKDLDALEIKMVSDSKQVVMIINILY